MQDATVCVRCVSILIRLTGGELLGELWWVVLRMARLVADFRSRPRSPEAMCSYETKLNQLLREAGRLIVQWTLNHLEPERCDEMPPLLLWDGDYYRRKGKSRLRNLHCLFGPVALRRFGYQLLETSGRGLFPLQVQLGIVAGVATPALADAVARWSADLTQQQVLEQLRGQGVQWSVRTLRKLTAAMATALGQQRHTVQVAQVLDLLARAAAGIGLRRVTLCVGRDGLMLPIVGQKKYKEAAAATVSVLDRWGKRLGTVYLAHMPEELQTTLSDELTRLLKEVLLRWEGPELRLVYVTDCGSAPTAYFHEVLSRMADPRRPGRYLKWEWIVDYYHACLYITKLAEALFGPTREAWAWAAKQRRVLQHKPGGVFRVLRSAGALLSLRGLVGSEDNYWSAYRYLRERAAKMDYRGYRRRKLPIGSGVTEAACKIVFTQRFKLSGMKWTIAGGAVILALRVLALSGLWSQARQAAFAAAPLPMLPTPTACAQKTFHFPGTIAA